MLLINTFVLVLGIDDSALGAPCMSVLMNGSKLTIMTHL